MNVRSACLALLAILVFVVPPLPGLAGSAPVTVDQVRQDRSAYLNEVVTIDGFVTQYVPSTRRTSAYYLLKDDYGNIIRVITTADQPAVNERYSVTGLVSLDPLARKDLVLIEKERQKLAKLDRVGHIEGMEVPTPPACLTAQAEAEEQAPDVPVQEMSIVGNSPLLIFGGLAAVGIALLGVIGYALINRDRDRTATALPPTMTTPPASGTATAATAAPAPAPAETIEGKTIKLHAPPAGTLKLLPGRFEVLAGEDEIREVRFYKAPGMSIPEITFGRSSGAPYKHVQLKAMTVSSQQAKLTYFNGRWTLTNLAKPTSNPTRVNDRELGVGEQVELHDGDTIEMGEVRFRFHANHGVASA